MRQSSTPCQIGVTYATSSKASGSWETGKNVPEKRNIGTIRKRKTGTKARASSTAAASAAIGIEKAVPIRTATGTTRRPHHDSTAPKTAITARYAAADVKTRVITKSW